MANSEKVPEYRQKIEAKLDAPLVFSAINSVHQVQASGYSFLKTKDSSNFLTPPLCNAFQVHPYFYDAVSSLTQIPNAHTYETIFRTLDKNFFAGLAENSFILPVFPLDSFILKVSNELQLPANHPFIALLNQAEIQQEIQEDCKNQILSKGNIWSSTVAPQAERFKKINKKLVDESFLNPKTKKINSIYTPNLQALFKHHKEFQRLEQFSADLNKLDDGLGDLKTGNINLLHPEHVKWIRADFTLTQLNKIEFTLNQAEKMLEQREIESRNLLEELHILPENYTKTGVNQLQQLKVKLGERQAELTAYKTQLQEYHIARIPRYFNRS